MILDPANQLIKHIRRYGAIDRKVVLEVGSGSGRITQELVKHASHVIASDIHRGYLAGIKRLIKEKGIEYVASAAHELPLDPESVDVVVYSLSLHHIPQEYMAASLQHTGKIARPDGRIVVIEPGTEGSFIELEEHFDVGDGNERAAKEAARQAMGSLAGWRTTATAYFKTLFYLQNDRDIWRKGIGGVDGKELDDFLNGHRRGSQVVLDADRRLDVLVRE
jgi:ubiquinone/menaquinone biosynthesis C-methylase UbiE